MVLTKKIGILNALDFLFYHPFYWVLVAVLAKLVGSRLNIDYPKTFRHKPLTSSLPNQSESYELHSNKGDDLLPISMRGFLI